MTTSTLRPNATDTAGSIALTGGATLHAVLSDNSDSSYGTINFFDSGRVQLGTVSMPAGAVTKTVTLRLRAADAAGSDGGITIELHVPLTFSTSDILVRGVNFVPTGSITTFADTPIAVSLTQAQIDSLVLVLANNHFDPIRMHEAYVDLTYALVPTVSVTAPTGTVSTSTSPTCSWTYTPGSDGDVQSRYQIRVFTAAQYGAGGFDPATSVAAYDSGVVLGAATSVTIGPLANSTTYRAYVNVAQTINGSPQWSGWSFSGFNVSLTTADIASVVATPSNANANISVVVTRVTAGSPPTWTSVEVQRSDDAGATWVSVRSANGAATSGTTFTVVDSEAGNGVSVVYRARATYLNSGLPVASAWVSSSSTSWTAAADWLKNVNHPSQNRAVTVVANPELTRRRPQGVNVVIGRSDPVIVSDVRSLTSGPLQFVTQTDQDRIDLLVLLANDVLFFQARPGAAFGQKYIAIGDVVETPVNTVATQADRWISVGFYEVLIPIDVGVS